MQEKRRETLVTPTIVGTRVILTPDQEAPLGQVGAEVSHLLGSDIVTIRSNIKGLPPTDLKGEAAMRHVRDALTRSLKLMRESKKAPR